ncbi:hypothetical protein BW247_13630 [Acidihalobacter ferrooxydans]|uniref:Uncharacterized protein n=1 Tax=Acidihalobacter ferrooxydans TaxID=1765967 RepID=A0A1P8UJM5_9GAMM|nr:hypothetical protein BW247_13630 [Acidihalobacter ferrooxydans]
MPAGIAIIMKQAQTRLRRDRVFMDLRLGIYLSLFEFQGILFLNPDDPLGEAMAARSVGFTETLPRENRLYVETRGRQERLA